MSESIADVKDFREVRNTEKLVRFYRGRAGERLYAYRSTDGFHHIVVSRGNETDRQWAKRVPAIRSRAVPEQQLWTVPDNWEQEFILSEDKIDHGIFHIPETDSWVKTSISTNEGLNDAWYRINEVGELTINSVGEMGSKGDIRRLVTGPNEIDSQALRADILTLAKHWPKLQKEFELVMHMVKNNSIHKLRPGDEPTPVRSDWTVEFPQNQYEPVDLIQHTMDPLDFEAEPQQIVTEIRDENLLPSPYKFKIGIDESAIGMAYISQALISLGCTPPEAVDYYMTQLDEYNQTDWAKHREVSPPTVNGNVKSATQKLKA